MTLWSIQTADGIRHFPIKACGIEDAVDATDDDDIAMQKALNCEIRRRSESYAKCCFSQELDEKAERKKEKEEEKEKEKRRRCK